MKLVLLGLNQDGIHSTDNIKPPVWGLYIIVLKLCVIIFLFYWSRIREIQRLNEHIRVLCRTVVITKSSQNSRNSILR